jgi:hypothetical protein
VPGHIREARYDGSQAASIAAVGMRSKAVAASVTASTRRRASGCALPRHFPRERSAPPNSMRAWREASSGEWPRSRQCSACISRCAYISSAMSLSRDIPARAWPGCDTADGANRRAQARPVGRDAPTVACARSPASSPWSSWT